MSRENYLDEVYAQLDKIFLLPCPFCGHTQQHGPEERVRLWYGGDGVYAQCGVCNAKGFRVPLPGHIDELKEFVHDVDLEAHGLSDDPNDWENDQLILWMGLFAAKFWNNRREPRDPTA